MPRFFRLICLSLALLGALSGCSQSPGAWWRSLNHKAQELGALEANYRALSAEHERLKRDYYQLEHEHMELKARVSAKESGEHNLAATGTLTGRTLASVNYQVPKGLKPDEIVALAYEHFNEKRFAEAAVTFEELAKRPETAMLFDAMALYTAGVSCFQIGNLNKAKVFLEEARGAASGDQREKIHKKVDLWLRVIDRRLVSEQGGGAGEPRAPARVPASDHHHGG